MFLFRIDFQLTFMTYLFTFLYRLLLHVGSCVNKSTLKLGFKFSPVHKKINFLRRIKPQSVDPDPYSEDHQ